MKKTLITLLQLAITVAVLYWVFHDPAKRAQMGVALRNANYSWIVAAIFAYMLVELAAGVRWQILLKVQRINLSLPRVSGLFFIGMFYNQFLPGGTGGDIIKTYLLLKEAPSKKMGALLAVMFDRLIGLVGLITITGCLIALRYDFLSQTPETKQLLFGLLIILGSAVLALVTTFVISGFNLLHLLPARIPGREKLIELSAAYHLYARHWFATLCAYCTSVVAHLSTFLTFFCVAKAFKGSSNIGIIDFFSIMPIERTVSSLPISLAGIGWREKVLQVLLSKLCDVDQGTAALIGSMSFLVMLVCCLPGGLVYFFYKPSGSTRHVKLSEMQEEVAALEHEITEQQ
ncbi:MAG: lysylphosphatidylglycerol synthase transmembrane domain-containing protein [Chthoniobacterales bacterium]